MFGTAIRFALFYLRSVAARKDYTDRVTGETIPAVTTAQIYKGSIAFIILQLIMVAAIIAYPKLVIGGLDDGGPKLDADAVFEQMQQGRDALESMSPGQNESSPKDDPMRGLLDAVKQDQK